MKLNAAHSTKRDWFAFIIKQMEVPNKKKKFFEVQGKLRLASISSFRLLYKYDIKSLGPARLQHGKDTLAPLKQTQQKMAAGLHKPHSLCS